MKYVEKRKHLRINKRMSFKLKIEDSVVTAEMINLSCSGTYCRVNKLIPLMTDLRIVLALISGNEENEVEYVECEGTVVRIEEVSPEDNIYNIAVFFNDIKEYERDKIANFIRKHQNPNL